MKGEGCKSKTESSIVDLNTEFRYIPTAVSPFYVVLRNIFVSKCSSTINSQLPQKPSKRRKYFNIQKQTNPLPVGALTAQPTARTIDLTGVLERKKSFRSVLPHYILSRRLMKGERGSKVRTELSTR